MHRRQAISLLLGSSLSRFLDPRQGCALLLDVRKNVVLATNGSAEAPRMLLPPGSALKPLTLAVLAKAGKLRSDAEFVCPQKLTLAGHRMDCSHPPIGTAMRTDTALAYSCNCFVAHEAARFGPGELARGLAAFGLNVAPLDGERQQLQALGAAGITVTPEALARAYRQLVLQIEPKIVVSSIREGMEGAVEFGTAQHAKVGWAKVAGKTGTSRIGNQSLAWFAGFAPSRAPEVVVVVMLSGQHGGSDAAPVAAEILNAWHGEPKGLKVRQSSDGRVVELPLERYVAGVLAGESGVFQSSEALKAMAVAARTYGIAMRGRHSAEGFDLCDTTHCQRMALNAITPRLTKAASDTEGQMLWYAGKPAFTPFSKDCGGRTEAGEDPWLRSHADPWCVRQPDSKWNWTGEPSAIVKALRQSSLSVPDPLTRITIQTQTASGRASVLLLSGTRISASSFRFAIGRAIGWNTIRSDLYQVRTANGQFLFEGSGSGHGIGLCQTGADAMGRAGKSWVEILAFYYPGTTAGVNGQGIRWQRLAGERVTLLTLRPDSDRPALVAAENALGRFTIRTQWPAPRDIEIRAYPDMDSFRNATAEPGWVAAHTVGHRIDLQPVSTLRSQNGLEATVAHEILHILMDDQAAPGLPLWFREGLAEYLLNPHVTGRPEIPDERDLRQTAEPARARRAYADAAAMVASLVRSYGETTVLGWVARGLPNISQAPVKSR
jgi:stage II sporulation protein D